MAVIVCDVEDCIHRSKRKLKSRKRTTGVSCYGCTLDTVVIGKIFDFDGDIEAKAGKGNTVVCRHYEWEGKS